MRAARRNHLESGYAMDDELVQAGTTVIVRAIVMDVLGGVGIQEGSITAR